MFRVISVAALVVLAVVSFIMGIPKAHAQTSVDIGTQKSPNFQTFTIKEVHPFPGVYCAVERFPKSFEESAYVAFDISLVTIAQIQKCMNKLPKGFVLREEYIPPLFIEDLRQSKVGHMSCEFVKPTGPLSSRYKVTFVALSILKDEDIKKCFEDAFDKQNVFKPVIGDRSYSL